MIIKDIAEYEETDSELAKYTIGRLGNEVKRLNNIIEDYENWLKDLGAWSYLDKLQKLKEGKQ